MSHTLFLCSVLASFLTSSLCTYLANRGVRQRTIFVTVTGPLLIATMLSLVFCSPPH